MVIWPKEQCLEASIVSGVLDLSINTIAKNIGTSGRMLVYHFGSKTTARIIRNNANRQFLEKWNMSISTLYKYYLKMGAPFEGPSKEPEPDQNFRMRMLRDQFKKRVGLS